MRRSLAVMIAKRAAAAHSPVRFASRQPCRELPGATSRSVRASPPIAGPRLLRASRRHKALAEHTLNSATCPDCPPLAGAFEPPQDRRKFRPRHSGFTHSTHAANRRSIGSPRGDCSWSGGNVVRRNPAYSTDSRLGCRPCCCAAWAHARPALPDCAVSDRIAAALRCTRSRPYRVEVFRL